MNRLFIAFAFAFVLAAKSPAVERPFVTVKSHPAHPTRILAKQRENIKVSTSVTSLSDLNLTVREQLSLVPGLVLLDQGSGPVRKNLDDKASLLVQRIDALRKTGLYEYVEPDYLVRASAIPTDTKFTDGTLWGLRNTGQSGGVSGADIRAVRAWDLTIGSTNVIVAIVDSGVRYTHNELTQQMWRNPTEIPNNGLDDDKDGYIDNVFGINAITGGGDPLDDEGHGTHMAGVIGAAAHDGHPIVGVAWKVRLMACKFLAEDGLGTTSDAIRSISFAVQKGAKIINSSWGGDIYSQALFDSVAGARDRGVLFVAAAGNDGINNDVFPLYPANFNLDNVIAVAALDRTDTLPDFANFGLRTVHVGAPGVAIYSSGKESDNDYFLANGSSPATAYVSGVAALVLARFPEIGMGELRTRLLETVVPVEALGGRTVTGGRVNAFNALNAQADGILEIGVSAAEGVPLIAGSTALLFVRVTDLSSITNATVLGSGPGFVSLIFRNDGLLPDEKAHDSVYSAALSVPANVTELTLTITASAPGKNAATQTVTYLVVSPPPNDNFEASTSLSGPVLNVTVNNRGASKEAGEPNHADEIGGKSLWWKWTAPASGTVTIDTDGSDFDTLLAVYFGTLVSNLTRIASNDDDGDSGASLVTFDALAGTVYGIAIDGFAGQAGNIELNLTHQSGATDGIPPQYMFTTLAGLAGNNGSGDGTGSTGRFNHPTKAALDSVGNLYVSDADNHTIRKITPGGVVSTFAGMPGSAGGADGPRTAARFRSPVALVVDNGGNIYVSDTYNHTIRKITPDGMVSTLAGLAGITGSADGTGSAARFYFPRGGGVDSENNFYFADQNNHTIRKITPGGVVSTLAGLAGITGSANGIRSAARFNFPGGVALDGRGNIYVADGFNNTVRKITPGGVVTTIAGLAGTSGSVDGPGSAARFKYPTDVAVDLTGHIYVLEYENHTLRRISPSGFVSTVAGLAGSIGITDGAGSTARFNQPVGVTVDSAGIIYVADTYNHTIRKGIPGDAVTNIPPFISAVSDQATPLGTPTGPLSFTVIDFQTPPADLVVMGTSTNPVLVPNSNIVLGGSGPNRTVTVTPAANQAGTTLIELIVSNGFLSNKTSFALTVYEPYTFITISGSAGKQGSADGSGNTARFNTPVGIARDGTGTIYVTDTINSTIRKIMPDGVVSTLAGRAGTIGSANGTGDGARFYYPIGLAVNSGGVIYVSDTYNQTIRKIAPDGVVSTLAGSAGSIGNVDGTGNAARFFYPRGAAVDRADNLYVADQNNHTIRKITPGGVTSVFAGSAGKIGSADGIGSVARFNHPASVSVDAADNIYVADGFNNTIRKITPSGAVTTIAGLVGIRGSMDGRGNAARFNYPADAAVDNAGNVYVTEFDNHTIRKITPDGVVITLAGRAGSIGSADGTGSTARFHHPDGLMVDKAGYIYVTDQGNHTIRKGVPVNASMPPVISVQPDSRSVSSGASVSFQVVATASTPLSYQWIFRAGMPPPGLIASWTGNGHASDDQGRFVGVLTNGAGFSAGKVGQGFRLDGITAGVVVPDAPGLNFAQGADLSIETWIHAESGARDFIMVIVDKRISPEMSSAVGYALSLWEGRLSFQLADAPLRLSNFSNYHASRDLRDGLFHHVAVTVDRDQPSGGKMYVDGKEVLTFDPTTRPGDLSNSGPLRIGHNSDPNFNAFFKGVIDEVRLYGRALSAAEIEAIFNAGADLAGATGSTLVLTNVQLQHGGTYAVRVSNAFGSVVSENATLTVVANGSNSPEYTFTTVAGLAGSFGSADGNGSISRFYRPTKVAVDGRGNVYVADTYNHTIRRLTPDGVVSTLAGLAGTIGNTDGTGNAARFHYPHGVVMDTATNIFVSDTFNNTIRKIMPNGVVSTLAGAAGIGGSVDGTGGAARFAWPRGGALDSANNFYVADQNNHTIRKITPSGAVSTLAGLAGSVGSADGIGSVARFYYPQSVTVDVAGNVYVADTFNQTIRKTTPTGAVSTLAGLAGTIGSTDGVGSQARFYGPVDVAVDGAGNVFVVEFQNHTVRRVSPNGTVSTLGGLAGVIGNADGPGSTARFYDPVGVAVDGAGILYVGDTYNHTIRKGVPASVSIPPVISVQPESRSVSNGASVSFQVVATGSAPLSYQWTVNSTDLAGATGSTLALSNVQLQHAGAYAVRVSNAFGTVTSNPATLTVVVVNAPPTISPISDQTTTVNVPTSEISFTISDAETAAENLAIIVTSSNTALLPNQNIFIQGTGANRTLRLFPEIGQTGSATITVLVKDGGQATASRSFVLTVTPAPRKMTIAAASDTSLLENNPDNNLGAAEEITAGTSSQGKKSRGLLKFDVSAHIPANATITMALLKASVVNAPTNLAETTFGLYRVLRDWGEGTKTGSSGQPATTNEATWNHRRTSSEAWGVPGGMPGTDYSSESSALTSTVAGPGGYYFNTSPGLIADVQAWVSNPATNFGWMVVGQSEATVRTERRFGSREASNDPPRLVLEFTLPAGANAPPTISQIPDQIISTGATTAALPFIIGDSETPAGQLTLVAVSSKEALLPSANIVLGGSGTNRTVTITPAPAQTGTESISITVTDGNGLSATRTFRVTVIPAGAEFLVESARGANGTVMVVPVRVRGFANLVNFQFSMHWNPAVVRFDKVEQFGLPSLAEANFGATDAANGTLRVSWDDVGGTGQSLANDTVIFAMRFEVLGNAGATSSVTINGVPTPMEVMEAGLKPVPLLPRGGEVVVGPPQLRVAGRVRYYAGDKSISGVALDVSGDALSRITSGSDGAFNFTLEAGGNYTLRPIKTEGDGAAQGVTTTDITFIRRHILAIQDLDSPYAILAGDVNDSGSVTTSDITFIRRVILGIDQGLPGGLWKFVRADQQFADPRQPWNHEKTRSVTGLAGDLIGQDFIAMKVGDVNASWSPPADTGLLTVTQRPADTSDLRNLGQPSAAPLETNPAATTMNAQVDTVPPVTFRVGTAIQVDGTVVEVPVNVSAFSRVTSVQFSIEWNSREWELTDIDRLELPRTGDENFGRNLADSGKLTFSWDDPAGYGVTLPDGEEIFRLRFAAKSTGAPLAVRFDDRPTMREVTVNGSPVLWRTEDERGGMASGDLPLKIESTTQNGERRIRLIIPTVAGRNYVLEFTDGLTHAEWRELDMIAGDGADHVLIDEVVAESQRFYRVRTW